MKQESARSNKSGHANTRVQSLSFAELPHQSRLFLEYLHDPSAVKEYYPNVTPSPLDVCNFASEVLANYKTDRERLCDALTEINQKIGASAKTIENIGFLGSGDTVAVVTGQQAGLFTGPLYTIYKAVSAIKLADELRESGTKAVPVFWIASEDHDFDEVAEVYLADKNGELTRSQYKPANYTQSISVGDVRLDASIAAFINDAFAKLASTEFSGQGRDLLKEAYFDGTGFGEAFAKVLAALFANYGLVVIDPLNEKVKKLASPIYREVIQNTDEIVAAIRDQNRSLEAGGFQSQVLVEDDYFPLFWHDDQGRRTALRRVGDGVYRVKGGKREFTSAELEKIASNEPQRFSPGVMLRGVVQDYLLPTICYFGGAAEIAYFAQNSAAYQTLKRPVTPVFHRQSFTVVESRQRRTLERFGWNLSSLFAGKEQAIIAAVERVLSPDMSRLFNDVEEKINAELNRLEDSVSASDVTLAANLETRRRKINYHITTLRKKVLMGEVNKDVTIRRQIDDLFNSLLPNGGLQERTLNVFSFINKHSFGFIDLLYNSVDLNDKGHRIIYL
ncbi:MAG: bacillithiol biosynthesis cysteine-adding enzyme BshC [Pyrinomonadaceae bacterium]